eukprot:533642-Alexandrium_andersonii.AAC.1
MQSPRPSGINRGIIPTRRYIRTAACVKYGLHSPAHSSAVRRHMSGPWAGNSDGHSEGLCTRG